MREVLFKNLTSLSSRKKNIFLKEIFEKDGIKAKTERRCFYYIRDIMHMPQGEDLQNWINLQQAEQPLNKRHFYIFKKHNDALGEDKLICKILGTFYAVVGQDVYIIAYLQSFKITFLKAATA
ncbi:MAG: hypothetical protein PHP46_02740 [Candidatus Omnitrophica bacterium]|nr:hypothetical protein [Candidatus Omnitrophota bacterium]